jgi:hypothetical protein
MESGRFPRFSGNGRIGNPGILRGFQESILPPVTTRPAPDLPDPLFMKNFQEFCIKQGVGGS